MFWLLLSFLRLLFLCHRQHLPFIMYNDLLLAAAKPIPCHSYDVCLSKLEIKQREQRAELGSPWLWGTHQCGQAGASWQQLEVQML